MGHEPRGCMSAAVAEYLVTASDSQPLVRNTIRRCSRSRPINREGDDVREASLAKCQHHESINAEGIPR